MVDSISVKIALDGGKEIIAGLEDIGSAGKKCFNDISAAAAKVGGFQNLDPKVATDALKEFGVTGEASINKIIEAVKKASLTESLVNGIRAVEAAFATLGTAVEKSITVLAKHAVASAGLGRAGVVAATTIIAAFGPFAIVAAAAVVALGALIFQIIKTTEEVNRLNAAAIQTGTAIAALSKAENIFKAIGLSSTDAAGAVSSFDEAMTLKNVKDAVANIDEFGRVTKAGANSFAVLEAAAKRSGEAGDLARQKLAELGRLKVSDAAKEIDKINQSLLPLPEKILALIGVLEKMKDPVERNRLIFANFSKDVATQLVAAFNAGGVSLEELKTKLSGMATVTQAQAEAATRLTIAWQQFKNLFTESFTGGSAKELDALATILNFIRTTWEAISNIPGPKASDTVREFQTIYQFLSSLPDLWNSFLQSAQTAVSTVAQFFSQLPGQIAGFFAGFGSNLWDGIVQSAATAWQTVIGWINKAIDEVKKFIGMSSKGGPGPAQGPGFASGGYIGGRGTGTSDSNLAWLSRGEHVMPARAVRQPGVLALLEALRRSGGNLSGVLDRLGHFALGGLVGPMAVPAFAGGGVNSMSHVTIAFPGLPAIGGLRASSAVVQELQRAAAMAQVRSGGRKPSRYG